MISTIFFDLDDTLLWDKLSVKKAFEATCLKAKQSYAISREQLEEAVRTEARKLYESYSTYSFTQMIGINPFEGLWGTFNDPGNHFQTMYELMPTYRINAWINGLKACGINDFELGKTLADCFIAERKKHPYVYKDTYAVLDELKNNYQLLLITNGSPSLQKEKLTLTPEIKPYFDHIIISGAFGVGKPDPSIFDHAVELSGVQHHEVIMVGDNLNTDILGSERAGIKNVWINHDNKPITTIQPTYEVKSLSEALKVIENLE